LSALAQAILSLMNATDEQLSRLLAMATNTTVAISVLATLAVVPPSSPLLADRAYVPMQNREFRHTSDTFSTTTLSAGISPQPLFVPQTELARTLLAVRERAIANGMRLLSSDEIENEVKERRGESK